MNSARRSLRCWVGTPNDGTRSCRSGRAAFSLLELLITVALILILTTMYWGSQSPSRAKKERAACQKNLLTTYMALQIYANDHSALFPAVPGAKTAEEPLDLLVPKYSADTSIFICPASHDSALPDGDSLKKHRISYAYFMGRRDGEAQASLMSDRLVDTLPKTNGQALFSTNGKPPGNNHGAKGGNFLFCDGHVEASPPTATFSIGLTQGVVLLNPKR